MQDFVNEMKNKFADSLGYYLDEKDFELHYPYIEKLADFTFEDDRLSRNKLERYYRIISKGYLDVQDFNRFLELYDRLPRGVKIDYEERVGYISFDKSEEMEFKGLQKLVLSAKIVFDSNDETAKKQLKEFNAEIGCMDFLFENWTLGFI